MPKCPNCGSTAQMTFYGVESNDTTEIKLYKCGCGCTIKQFWEATKTVCYDEDGSLLFVNFSYEKQM